MKTFIISMFIACIFASPIIFTLSNYGVTWDEPIYMETGRRMVFWLNNPQWNIKNDIWEAKDTQLHPPLSILISGLTNEILCNKLKLVDTLRAHRLGTIVFFIPMLTFIIYFLKKRYGWTVAIITSLLCATIPSMFFLAHVESIDMPICALWIMTIISIIEAKSNKRWLIITGILLGLSLLTKIHGVLLFPLLLLYTYTQKKYFHKKEIIISLFILPLIIFYIGWPYLWDNPIGNFMASLKLLNSHGTIPTWYMGQSQYTPWHYPFVMIGITTPSIIIITFIIGIVAIIKRKKRDEWFLLLNALYLPTLFTLPIFPKYDSIRLFLACIPFIIIVAGIGTKYCIDTIKNLVIKKITIFTIIGLTLYTIATQTMMTHPYQSSYYNELVGGIDGATSLGFETDYWGSAYKDILPWMNDHKKDPMCVFPMTSPFYVYKAWGQLENDVIIDADANTCIYAVVLMRQGMFDKNPFIKNAVMTLLPIYSIKLSSTPIINIYKLK